ncbi:MAG: hypothetical protein K6G75_06585 [Lachnospiraceae bacterium]|nr:hypothetical protein [Lachnospiraceae bacterium]
MKLIQKSKALMMIGIAIAAVLSLTGCSLGKKKVNLNKYIIIETEGYDTLGLAYYDFDLDQFEADYAGKIKMPENHSVSENYYLEFEEPLSVEAMLLLDCIKSISFDKDYDLSNGDEIRLSMDINNTIALEYYNTEVEFTDITYKVENLKQAADFNPFDYITVTFSGSDPYGKAAVDVNYDAKEMEDLYVTIDGSSSELKNGDTVKVTVSQIIDDRHFVTQYGEVLSQTEKTYTVEGLTEYLNDVSLIPEDLYNQMNQQLLDYFNSYRVQHWEEDSEILAMDLLGTYLLNAKPGKVLEYKNRLYFVYKVVYSNKKVPEFTYYWYGEFTNLTVDPEGNVDVDLNGYMYCWAKSGFFSDEGDYLKVGDTNYYVAGFETIDDFEKTYILSKLEDYTYVQDVK